MKKTAEELLRECYKEYMNYCDPIGFQPYIYKAMHQFAAQEVEEATKWISVEERLPKKEGHYFVRVRNSFPKNCDVIVCEFYEDNRTFYSESGDNPIHDALFWMEIPKK